MYSEFITLFTLEILLAIGISILALWYMYLYFPKKSTHKQFIIRNRSWFTPDNISALRMFSGIPIALTYYWSIGISQPYLSIFCIIITIFLAFTDAFDGIVARLCNIHSENGKSWDALCDKWFDIPILIMLSYMISLEALLIVLGIALCDIIGQTIRGNFSDPAASPIGKAKTTIKFMSLYPMSWFGRHDDLYHSFQVERIIIGLLVIALLLAFASMALKTKQYRQLRIYIGTAL